MSDRHIDQKTNIDDIFIPGWLMWLAWWSGGVGCIATILFLITAFGFETPVNHVYFSPRPHGVAMYIGLRPGMGNEFQKRSRATGSDLGMAESARPPSPARSQSR